MSKTQLGQVVFPPKKYELIEAITLTEDTLSIVRDTEPDGTPYDFSKMLILASIQYTASEDSGDYSYTLKDKNGTNVYATWIGTGVATGKRTSVARIWIENGIFMGESASNAAEYPAAYKYTTSQLTNSVFIRRESGTPTKGVQYVENIAYLGISQNNNRLFAAGSEFYIYAVRN